MVSNSKGINNKKEYHDTEMQDSELRLNKTSQRASIQLEINLKVITRANKLNSLHTKTENLQMEGIHYYVEVWRIFWD